MSDVICTTQGNKVVIYDGGYVSFQNSIGRSHRAAGPSYICPNGYIEYRVLGLGHRTDGPAVRSPDRKACRYYLTGRAMSPEDYFLHTGKI